MKLNLFYKNPLIMLGTIFLCIITIGSLVLSAPYPLSKAALWPRDPKFTDEEHVIVQVCYPNKTVKFEDITINLPPELKPLPLSEIRKNNGVIEPPNLDREVALATPNQGSNPVVKRWLKGEEPNGVTDFLISLNSVRDFNHGKTEHVSSQGSEFFFLLGETSNHQPVYEIANIGSRQIDSLAYYIMTGTPKDKASDRINYWYKLPKIIPNDVFTPWIQPVSQETLEAARNQKIDTGFKIIRGQPMEYSSVNSMAPKIRFRITTLRDYYNAYKFWHWELASIRKKYYSDWTGIVEPRTEFEPLLSEIIPNCDKGEILTKETAQYW